MLHHCCGSPPPLTIMLEINPDFVIKPASINLVWMTAQGKYTVCVLSGKVASILKYAKCLIHIDLCPVAIHRFEKSVNKKKDKLIKKNIVHNTVGDQWMIDTSDCARHVSIINCKFRLHLLSLQSNSDGLPGSQPRSDPLEHREYNITNLNHCAVLWRLWKLWKSERRDITAAAQPYKALINRFKKQQLSGVTAMCYHNTLGRGVTRLKIWKFW